MLTSNEYLKSYIKENYALDSKLEIEYEKYYSKFFLPSSRSQAGGSKKRYAGLLTMGGFEEVVFTGMEFVRSDWTLAAKNFQRSFMSVSSLRSLTANGYDLSWKIYGLGR